MIRPFFLIKTRYAAAAANVFHARCENEKVRLSPATIRFFPVNSLLAPVNRPLSSDRVIHQFVMLTVEEQISQFFLIFSVVFLALFKNNTYLCSCEMN